MYWKEKGVRIYFKDEVRRMKISFVIPCYRSQNSISDVVDETVSVAEKLGYEYEFVLVDDCSPDDTLTVIRKICSEKSFVKGVSLSRNFGQAAAIMAGLSHVEGDYIICMDDDGQAPVDEMYKLVEKAEEGYDVVFSKYSVVKQSFSRNMTSKINAFMAKVMTGKPKGVSTASFFIMRRYVAKEMIKYVGPYPYLSGLIFRITRRAANVDVQHRERVYGKSGYTLKKLLSLWMNGFTSFSILPLRFAMLVGFVVSIFGGVLGIYTICRKIMIPTIQIGYSSTITLICFIGGIILLCLGLIGEYLGRDYMCSNQTPQYIEREIMNIDEEGKKDE